MILKKGMGGRGAKRSVRSSVAMVQTRLKRLGFFPASVKATGFFGDVTEDAVVRFQKHTFPHDHAEWDGVVGSHTWAHLFPKPGRRKGVVKAVVKAVVTARPRPFWALTQSGRKKRLGANETAVRRNLVVVSWRGSKYRIHRLAVGRFRAILADIEAYEKRHGLDLFVPEQVGTFCWRLIRGSSTTLSNHAFGTAWDWNWKWNPMTRNSKYIKAWYASTDPHRIPDYVFSIVKKHGGRCGRDYSGRKDFMHFEL